MHTSELKTYSEAHTQLSIGLMESSCLEKNSKNLQPRRSPFFTNFARLYFKILLNPFYTNVPLLYPLGTSENVFREYANGALA